MAFRTQWGVVAAVVALGWAGLAGCGNDVVQFGSGGSGASGASGGEGGTTSTSSSGGSTSSTGGGGSDACAEDCSAIATPPCEASVCNEDSGECELVPDEAGSACDDGLFCTMNDACDGAGTCVGGPQNDCGLGDPDQCQEITCDESSQTCAALAVPNGAPCTSTDLCVENATCNNGLCEGPPKSCNNIPLPNECFVGQCDPMDGQCKPVTGNDGQGCLDLNDLCTENKTCAMGVCQGGTAVTCPSTSCTAGSCDPNNGQCLSQPLPMGTPCPEGDGQCTTGICTGMGSCVTQPANQGQTCSDGLSCTTGETCNNGVCSGGTSNVTVYFSEDFSDNSAGWTLDTEWQIGPAMASMGQTQSCGNGDPATDHTPGNDNGVAGVVIGGNASPMQHPYYWLTSPVVDTTAATTLFLEYFRWLNSDYQPFMVNQVQVYDGMMWQTVFQTGPAPITDDGAWTQLSHDVTAFSNANFQIRFGFEIGNNGVWTCSGWNLDDVTLQSGPCL